MTAHISGRLTVPAVKAAPPGKHPDGANLWLQVGPSGSRSWYMRYTLRGRTREMGLGPFPLVGLAEARAKATAQRRLLLDGIDPIEARNTARRPQRETVSFEAAAKQYITGHEAAWSKDHGRQWRSSLARYVYPAIGARAVDTIDTHDVLSIVEPLWQTRTETATRVANRIALILDWATARKLRSGDNPARWKGHLDAILPKRSKVQREEHHAALAYAKMPEFMATLRQASQLGAKAAALMVLTATRTGEVRFAAWSEIDLDSALWTIPAARMKAARDHRIPLSQAAVAILTELERKGELVFPGLGQHAILKSVQRIDPAVTAHGFRSAFADWAAEQTGFPAEVREMALAHAVGDKVEAAYRRGDLFSKRRQLAEAWAKFCAGGSGGKVVPIRRAAAGG